MEATAASIATVRDMILMQPSKAKTLFKYGMRSSQALAAFGNDLLKELAAQGVRIPQENTLVAIGYSPFCDRSQPDLITFSIKKPGIHHTLCNYP